LVTFVIVGGEPTGVELAGALGEIVQDVVRHDFREINLNDSASCWARAPTENLAVVPAGALVERNTFLAAVADFSKVRLAGTTLG
jgi:NADH dehydrogenase FAD-containing subunit